MPRIVRVCTDENPEGQVFVSLEQTPLVLSDVRRDLPQLKRELCRKWRVLHVAIENRIPHRRNPHVPGALVAVACVGLVVKFGLAVADGAGKKIGETIGQEIVKYVNGWIKRIGKSKAARKRSARPRKRPE